MGTRHTGGSPASTARERKTSQRQTPRPGGATLTSIPRVADERAYLYEIIRTIGAGPDLDSILSGVVRLATEATGCHACLIWFLEGERLTLRASSTPYSSLAGTLSVAMGEGLVGWVAATRRSTFIEEHALNDPRVKYFPELEEEHFQSLVSVPIFGRDGEVMGVISLHAEAPHEFARADLDLLEHTASLMSGAVENARLYDDSTARVQLMTDLSELSERIATSASLEELIQRVCAGTRELLRASRCVVCLIGAGGELEVRASVSAPGQEEVLGGSGELAGARWPRDGWDARRLATLLFGDDLEGEPMLARLSAGDEHLGLLGVVSPTPPPGAHTALAAVASHTTVAIRQHELVERLLEKNVVTEFFHALARGDRASTKALDLAARLGVELDEPHTVVVGHPWIGEATGSDPTSTTWNEEAVRLEATLAALPGALVDHVERSVRALVPTARDELDHLATDVETALERSGRATFCVGISEPCSGVGAYADGFREAASAAEIGALLRGAPGVSLFRELGGYRYVLAPPDALRDRDRLRLMALVDYDRRRGTELLDTLERFLDERGNAVGTARSLYIHPNTLRQRIERIERETGIDLEHGDWLSLAIAVKSVKLELLRGTPAI
jgi:GAF domain-containing protein